MSQQPKYVAAGFMEDADRLFAEFAKEPNNDYETFAELWKKRKFVYIFMGRPDEREYKDFVNEIYQLLLAYIESTFSFDSQISAVYLLYTLYRHQDILPTITIRVNQSQYGLLKKIHLRAYEQKLRHLHYIMDYLNEHALDFVFHGSLYGPCSSKNNPSYATPKQEIDNLSDLKQDMAMFYESNVLKDLKSLHLQYLEKKEILLPNKSSVNAITDVKKRYEELDLALNCLINNKQSNKEGESSNGIGGRRAMLKNASFQRKAMFRYLNSEDGNDLQESELPPKKPIRQKRVPANKRRLGRPRKVEIDEDSSKREESDDTKLNIVGTPAVQNRGPIGRKRGSYLKKQDGPVPIKDPERHSFTEESSDSSHDDDESVDLVF